MSRIASKVNVSIRLKPERIKQLDKLADKLNCHRSELMRDFIKTGIKSNQSVFFDKNDSILTQKE